MKADPSARPPVKCRVLGSDPRRGTAVLIDEKGRRIRLGWDILKDGPILLRGMAVLVSFDDQGSPKGVKLA